LPGLSFHILLIIQMKCLLLRTRFAIYAKKNVKEEERMKEEASGKQIKVVRNHFALIKSNCKKLYHE